MEHPSLLQGILKSDLKSKEKIAAMAEALLKDHSLQAELIKTYDAGTVADKGNLLSAIALVTEQEADWAENCLDFVFAQLNHKAPRVKWESATVVANVAAAFPMECAKVIPALVANTGDPGTVVRWSAASALTAIARNNPEAQPDLLIFFGEQVASEQNNGVRKIYEKTLRKLMRPTRKASKKR